MLKSRFLVLLLVFSISGCVVATNALDTHRDSINDVFEEDYVVLKKPVDRHYIGNAWSKQFGPIVDSSADDIRVRTERSLNNIQQDYAYNLGMQAGGVPVGTQGTSNIGVEAKGIDKSQLEGVEIIKPYSLADIPFKPKVAYVTEALRLANFKIKEEKAASLSAGFIPTALTGGGAMSAAGSGGTEGSGLVVAYKLHAIDLKKYSRQETGSHQLELDKTLDLPAAGVLAKARLRLIDPGAGRSLPRNLLWACPQADAMSRNMVAAWVVDIKPRTAGKKSLAIGFPAYPVVEGCDFYSGIISSEIDPVTDQIKRQVVDIVLIDAEVDDSMQPLEWDASISIVDEQFNIRTVKASEVDM